ncbi:hypothetical protein ACOIDN_33590, partial [Klebsiella pneumoniae]|uniref:hypothetical protein n=1 Tax=Klebsiella pneumoniae TaxID=573 RepID=UPI003B5A659E
KYRITGPDYARVQTIARTLASVLGSSPVTREVNLTAGEPDHNVHLVFSDIVAWLDRRSSTLLASLPRPPRRPPRLFV